MIRVDLRTSGLNQMSNSKAMHILIDNGSDYFFVRLIPIWFFKGRLLHSKRRPFAM